MMELNDLPALNATLNGFAFVLLLCGYVMICRGRLLAHKRFMLAAFAVSILFFTSYLIYRIFGEDKKFGGQGWIRPVYYLILISHVALAATVPFLATYTLYLGLRARFDRHRRLARITFPIWVYVSVTGVLVYLLLFVIYGPVRAPGAAGDAASGGREARRSERSAPPGARNVGPIKG